MSPSRIAERYRAISNGDGRNDQLVELQASVLRDIRDGNGDPKEMANAALGETVFDIKNEISNVYAAIANNNFASAAEMLQTIYQRLP